MLQSVVANSAIALVLDWDGLAWTAGSLSNSYDLSGDATNDVTVAMGAHTNTFTNDATSGTMTPAINQSITGGTSPVQNSLILGADLKTQSDITVQVSFTGQYHCAENVSFTLFDIDLGTNSDKIETIYGLALDGTQVAATIANVGSAVTLSGTGLTQLLTGNVASANSGAGSANGNATISFGSTVVTDVFFTFSNTAGAPRYQEIAIGDLFFTPVPETNPAVVASASCLAAIALTIFARCKTSRQRDGFVVSA